MSINTIEDVYAANSRMRQRLLETLSGVGEDEASKAIEGERWTVAEIVEHLSMVEESISKVCAKLLRKAQGEGKKSDGRVTVSDGYIQKSKEIAAMRLEAPEFVHPKGSVTLVQSFDRMRQTGERLQEIKPLFMEFDGTDLKFPHPFFGDISAHEWLVLIGGHERRHTAQIRRILGKDK